MNKKVLFASIIALSGIFASASAQKPQQDCCSTDQACTTEQTCNLPDCNVAYNPFAGLNLTAQQQAKLDALKQEKQAAKQAAKEAAKKEKAERKQQDRQQAKNGRSEDLAKIKAILTPEQYVTFLENNYLNAGIPRQQMRAADRKFDKSKVKAHKADKLGNTDKAKKGDKGKK